jgi:hypothetical protein
LLHFYPLLLVLNFHFFSAHRFFLSFVFICFSFFSSLLPSTFCSLCLVHVFFPCLFLFPIVFRLSQTLRFPLTFILFSSHHSLFPSLVSFFPHSIFFHAIFFRLMIRKTPKLTPCTSCDVTSTYLSCRPSGVNWRQQNRRCNLQRNKNRAQ